MGAFWDSSDWFIVPFIFLYMLVLTACIQLCRRYYLCQIASFCILPLAVIPLSIVLSNEAISRLDYVQFTAYLIACLLLHTLRHNLNKWRHVHSKQSLLHHQHHHHRDNSNSSASSLCSLLLWLYYALISLQIACGVYMDLRQQYQQRHLNPGNALLGIILMLTLPNPLHVTVSDDELNCIRYRVGLLWILGCIVWTAVCVLNIDSYTALHLVLLYMLTPLIMLLWTDCNEWMQHVTYSLYFSQCINLLPVMKNNLPFYVLSEDVGINEKEYRWIKDAINWAALCYGLLILFKSLCDEIHSWNGKKKPFDTSFLQWYTSSKANIVGLQMGEIPYRANKKSIIVRKFEAAQLQFGTPHVTRLFMVQEETDEYV